MLSIGENDVTPKASMKLQALQVCQGDLVAAKAAARWLMSGIPKEKLDGCGCSGKSDSDGRLLTRLRFLRQKFAPMVPHLGGVPPTITIGRAYFTQRFGDAAADLLGIAPLNPDALLAWLAAG